MRRTITTLAVAALALGWTTACEPPPPPASFTVNVAPGVTGGDATPGDGVCETAPGNGVCTLDAAVQEGNALGRADIHVPQSVELETPLVLTETTITGHLAFISVYNYSLRDFEIRAPHLHVATGALLSLEQVDLHVTGATSVAGALAVHRSSFVGWLDVHAGAVVSMVNSIGGAWASTLPPPTTNAWITNRGTVLLRFSYLIRFGGVAGSSMGAAFVHTLDGGTTTVGATVFERYSLTSPDCLGTPASSEGYNNAKGCGFAGPGDIDDGNPSYPLSDVPRGVAGCGTDITIDFYGDPRPSPDFRPDHCSRGLWE